VSVPKELGLDIKRQPSQTSCDSGVPASDDTSDTSNDLLEQRYGIDHIILWLPGSSMVLGLRSQEPGSSSRCECDPLTSAQTKLASLYEAKHWCQPAAVLVLNYK